MVERNSAALLLKTHALCDSPLRAEEACLPLTRKRECPACVPVLLDDAPLRRPRVQVRAYPQA